MASLDGAPEVAWPYFSVPFLHTQDGIRGSDGPVTQYLPENR